MSDLFVFVNDDLVPASRASLLVSDLAIQRGYGVFDFFKTIDHIPVFFDAHLDRFFRSAAQLRLPVGRTRDELRMLIYTLQQKNNIPDSGIRLTLTGGYSPDGYSLEKTNLIITQQPLVLPVTAEIQKSIQLVTYPHQRQMPDAKTIDYLMAIWLQPYIRERGADDVLYQRDGIVSECPRSNFFIVTANDVIVTPAHNILKGVIRSKVLELADRQFKTEERDITIEELSAAKEAFITSTTRHIVPVSRIDGQIIAPGESVPGGGTPGEISQWLNRELYRLVKDGKLNG